MTGLDLAVLGLAAAVGALAGAVIAWLVSASMSRREIARVEGAWNGRLEQARNDSLKARTESRELERIAVEASGNLVKAEQDVAALRRQAEDLGRLLAEARRSREAIRHQNVQLTGELEAARAKLAELPPPAERERDVRALADRLAAAATRLDQAVAARQASEAERTRLSLQLEAVTRQLQQSNDLARADRVRFDGSLVDQAAQIADLRRQLELAGRKAVGGRAETVEQQERLAAALAELGAAQAQLERLEPLRRQLEDREALIRSLVTERDDAASALVRREGELSQRVETLVAQVAAGARAARALEERDRELAAAARQLGSLERERDDLAAIHRRQEAEIAALRSEIKDRDARFRVLLDDRRAVVEAKEGELARLKSLVDNPPPANGNGNGHHPASSAPAADDLKRISGIGPSLEKLLNSRGVTTFRQIALWTEADIERIAADLGSFRSRISRDRWIEQALREHQRAHGETLER